MSRVKVSVYVPTELHKRAKHESIDKGTTMQHVLQDALEKRLAEQDAQVVEMKPREAKVLIGQLREVLSSGKKVFIESCSSAIRGAHALLQYEKTLVPQNGNIADNSSAEGPAIRRVSRRAKRGAPPTTSGVLDEAV